MSKKHQELKTRLTDAIVNLCRQEAFYFQELKIEGTVCLTSDGSSVLITQITEQIGEQFDGVDNSDNLPVRSKDKEEDKNGDEKEAELTGDSQGKDGDGVSVADGSELPIERTDGKFKCPHCPKMYQFKHSLKDHINVHTGKKPHVCKHCNYAFTHFASLCAHIKKRHYQHMPDGFECHICEEKFMNEQSLKQHFTWRHKGELPLQWALVGDTETTEEFEEDPDAEETEETESKIGEERDEPREQAIATEESGGEKSAVKEEKEETRAIKTEKTEDEREVPGNSATLNPETPQLPPGVTWNPALAAMQAATAMGMGFPGFMQSPFTAPGSVGAEVANHAGAIYALSQLSQATPSPRTPRQDFERSPSGKFLCPYCDKQYNFKHTLKDHVNKHLGKRPHVCKHCGDSFTHLASLCAHIKRRHNSEISSEYQCEICNEKFMNFQSLKQHYTWRHKDKKVPLKRTVPPPETAEVQPTRKSARLTTTAPTTSQSVFPGSSFEESDAMTIQNSQSSNEDNSLLLSTDGANESFDSSSSLSTQPHVSVDGVVGNHDDSPSASIHEYFTDINVTTPQGHYKYKCKLCGNMFKIRNSLYEHLNSHLGRKPHVCTYCGDAFTHHSSLHNHVRNKHTSQSREEREAQFKHECSACHRKFRFKSELERHIRYNPDHAEGGGETLESDRESTTEIIGDTPPTEEADERNEEEN